MSSGDEVMDFSDSEVFTRGFNLGMNKFMLTVGEEI